MVLGKNPLFLFVVNYCECYSTIEIQLFVFISSGIISIYAIFFLSGLEVIMLIPTKNRKAIYEYLFNEGVAVAKKDFNLKTHPNIEGVTNLEVIKTLKVCLNLDLTFSLRYFYCLQCAFFFRA